MFPDNALAAAIERRIGDRCRPLEERIRALEGRPIQSVPEGLVPLYAIHLDAEQYELIEDALSRYRGVKRGAEYLREIIGKLLQDARIWP